MLTARQIDIIERQQREKDAEILRLRQRNDVLIEQIVKLEQVPAETAMLRDANQRLRQRVERLDLLLRRSREILDDAWVDGRNEKRTDLVSDISAALADTGPQVQGLIGGAAPGLQEPPPSYRSRLLEEDKQPAEPTVPVKFQNIGPVLSDEVCHPIEPQEQPAEPPKVRRNVVFAEPVGGTGGYLVTLDCGHKLATRKRELSYDCRECEKENDNANS